MTCLWLPKLGGDQSLCQACLQDFCLLQNQVLTIRDCGSSALFIVFFSYLKDLTEVFLLFSRQFASFSIGSFPAFPTTHFNLRDYLYYSHDCSLLLHILLKAHVHPHHLTNMKIRSQNRYSKAHIYLFFWFSDHHEPFYDNQIFAKLLMFN